MTIQGGIRDTTPAVTENRVVTQDGDFENVKQTGALGGGTLIRVHRPDREDLYLISYHIPNTKPDEWIYYQFSPEDTTGNGTPDQVEGALGPAPSVVVIDEAQLERRDGKNMFFGGDASEVTSGDTGGTFAQYWSDVMRTSLIAGGVTDPGIQGKLMNDPQYASLAAKAGLGIITDLQMEAEFRNLGIYQEVYPGIDFFTKRGDVNPEVSWRNYQTQVTPLLRELGYVPGVDGNYNEDIKDFLDKGIDASELQEFAPTLKKIQQNPGLKAQMDAWAVYTIGRTLDFDEFADVLQGTTDPELNSVIDNATLAFQAEQAGLQISVDEIKRISERTDMTEAEALQAFTSADAALLSIGEQELAGYGVTRGDFLDVAVGDVPRSGVSRASVLNLQDKLFTERGLSDNAKAGFFLGFSDTGQAQRQGLTPLAGQGG